ncbi:cyclic GMP-AMP synthase-like [Scleropages formosus]|uniref:Cyclic GMP-AMP synthase n=1 Tax=Scleropages formosus TaxID=113540 RepID=A0A0P7U0B4_SCLFO|nr:cyclic GMP-AMP synthase-like [Scleropages formosus]KPP63698.1 cyclic GMP-AMP synthase-like [Scleropages formosus]
MERVTRSSAAAKPSPRTSASPRRENSNGREQQQQRRRDAAASAARAGRSIKKEGVSPTRTGQQDPLHDVLTATLRGLRIRKQLRSESTAVINSIVDVIFRHLRSQKDCFSSVERLRTGSYYENVKIRQPDEFDVMLAIPVRSVEILPFDDEGAFYSVAVKGRCRTHPLEQFVLENGVVSANEMLTKFRKHVVNALKKAGMTDVQVERKKKGCPAVTLLVTEEDLDIGLDIVFGLAVHSSWPSFTNDGFKIEKWLGSKTKKNFKLKPFYLVPKYEGNGNEELDGVCARDTWRISFSHVEKEILKSHGSTKTCCEVEGTQCCRRECLKLLKHLLKALQDKYPKDLPKFYSYQAKTTLLHACTVRVHDADWRIEDLAHCFHLLLEDFQRYLREGYLPNYFIPTHNLLGSKCSQRSCNLLADYIAFEQNNMFPIFFSNSCIRP